MDPDIEYADTDAVMAAAAKEAERWATTLAYLADH